MYLLAIVATKKSGGPAQGNLLVRLRRFLQKPWREKLRWVERRTFSKIPRPVRLPSGVYFFKRNDSLGINLQTFETRELAFAEGFFRPGMTVLDIGAHQGLYTLLAARCVRPSGRVFSFEPSPRERRALRLNLAINFCDNVAIQPLALGSNEATADLYVVDEYNTGYNSLRPPNVPQPTRAVPVKVDTLDHWLAEKHIDRVDFIKLDVEGAELSVLRGASKSLVLLRPVLLVEVAQIRTSAWGYHAIEIVRFMQNIGYEWFQILDGGKLGPVSQIDPKEMNLVAIPRRHK
jgi:FkbM family methyltransferase